jgi:hypothetical protein
VARIEFDESLFPILVQWMPGTIHDPDVAEMMAFLEKFMGTTKTPFALIVDCALDHHGLTVVQRKRVAEWSNALQDRGANIAICTAIVLRSRLMRGALTALDWITPPRKPRKGFATLLEGFDYCIAELEQAGVVIPQRVWQHRNGLLARAAR